MTASEGTSRYDEALRWSELAARSTPSPEPPVLEIDRLWARVTVLRGLEQGDGVLETALAAHARAESAFDERDPRLADAEAQLGITYLMLGRAPEGCPWIRRAYDRRRELLGADHPSVAESHDRLARCEMIDERRDEAERHYREALAILGAVYPADHRWLARSHLNFAWLLMTEHRYEEAREQYRLAERGYRAAGHEHLATACVGKLGEIEVRLHHPEPGLALLDRAHEALARLLPENHPDRARNDWERGHALRELGRREEALEAFRRAQVAAAGSARPSFRAFGLIGEGLTELESGHPAEAVTAFEEALSARAPSQDANERAAVELHLARALVASGGDAARARELAEGARAHYATLGSDGGPMLAEIDAWLAHPSLERRREARGRELDFLTFTPDDGDRGTRA